MSIERLRAHYGFGRMPFGRELAPGMLHRHHGHDEAVARITWCTNEAALGVITGEVGAGKTVAVRAAVAGLDTSRHTIIYLSNPAVGARGLYTAIVAALGGTPRIHKAALIPQATDALAAESAERGKNVVLIVDLCRAGNYADGSRPAMAESLVGAGFPSWRVVVWSA